MPISAWRAPIFRLVIPFAVGIIIYDWLVPSRAIACFVAIGCVAIAIALNLLPIKWRWKWQSLHGASIWISVVSIGLLYGSMRDLREKSDWIGRVAGQKLPWLIECREEAIRTKNGWRIKADVIGQFDSTGTHPARGGILIYTKDSAYAALATPGRKAWIQSSLRPITYKPGSDFNYVRYCRLNKITHQSFIPSKNDFQFLPPDGNGSRSILHGIRKSLLQALYTYIPDSTKAGLSAALLIGWKNGLDPDLKQHYTRTGTVHIIAISGQHISLVFEILWILLYPFLYLRGGGYIRTTIALLSIWIFCFLAGGEASVLRAGIMFSVLHLGRWLQRPVTGEQALGLSMMCLLVADPDWLFDVGFQLSHAAVLGMLLFQARLAKKLSLQNPILKNIGSAACMTIAATIGTLPLTAIYFRQFPLLFLPANLIAVPLSSLALIGLFLLIPLTAWPDGATAWGYCLDGLLTGMNGWVERLDRIPGMVWQW